MFTEASVFPLEICSNESKSLLGRPGLETRRRESSGLPRLQVRGLTPPRAITDQRKGWRKVLETGERLDRRNWFALELLVGL
jgi:hypothetical protein